ncbi:hypothetical protein E4U59_000220, partial [Claviceps monticola]
MELYAHIEMEERRHETPLVGLEEDQDELVQMVREKLPKEYWDYADVFSKMGAEQLPPRGPELTTRYGSRKDTRRRSSPSHL